MTRDLGLAAARFAIIGGVLGVAVLVAGHGDSWTNVIALGIAVVAFVLLIRVQGRGRRRTWLSFAACALVLAGGNSLVQHAWVAVVGREATATVSHTDTYCTGRSSCDRHEEYTLRLPDGSTVDGKLRGYHPGAYQVGDRVDVRYDPTGLVRNPVSAAEDLGVDVALGAAGLLAGLALLAGVLLTGERPPRGPRGASAPAAAPQRSNL